MSPRKRNSRTRDRSTSAAAIVRLLGLSSSAVHGELKLKVSAVAPIWDASSRNELTFCTADQPDASALIQRTRAGLVLCPESVDVSGVSLRSKTLILVEDPRRACIKVMRDCFTIDRAVGIHRTATVHRRARIGRDCYVGAYCYVGPGVSLGDGSTLIGHVHVYGPAVIGKRCTIHAGAVLGADGFGFWRNPDGSLDKFPHVGGIRIGDDVEIGANTAIDRGTLGNTVVGNGTKIDNLVHIGHNVQIAEHCVVIAQSLIGGSVKIGPRSWIAPSACLRDRIDIGADVVVGLGAVVTKSVPDGQTVMGVPAVPRDKFLSAHRDK